MLKKVSPSLDLGEFLRIIKNEYNGIGNGFSLEDTNELALLFENSQLKAGIIEEVNYTMTPPGAGQLPVVSKKPNVKPNLNYSYYILEVDESRQEFLIADRAKQLRMILTQLDDALFRSVIFIKDNTINILINSANDEGGLFTPDYEKKLENSI